MQQQLIFFEKKEIIESFISHKTQFNKLRPESKIKAVSIFHLVSQKTLDLPKIYHNQEKHVKPNLCKENTSFCSVNSLSRSINS